MDKQLKEWQPAGIEFLRTRPGGILGDEQGLGKTVMFICAAKNFNGPVLCIVRPLAKLQTTMMLREWDPGTPIVRCVGSGVFAEDVVKSWFEFPRKRGYLLVHHEAVRLIADKLRSMGIWEIVLVDEAHRMGNPKSQITRAIRSLHSFYRWALTGTVMDRSPSDYWSLMNWFNPQKFSSYWGFYAKYVDEIRSPKGQIVKRRPKNLEMFAKEVGPYILMRKAKEVGMDEPLYESIHLEMYPKQRVLYEQLKKETLVFAERESTDDPIFVKNVLQRMYMLQRVTLSTELLDVSSPSVKLDYVKDFCEDYPDPLIVFTHSREGCKMFSGYVPGSMAITGDTPDSKRDYIMALFRVGKIKTLFLVTDLAAESISLSWVSRAIFLDTHPSSRLMSQAEMRIRRADSTKRPTVYTLVCENTVDEPLLRRYREKLSDRELVEEFIRRGHASNSHQ